MQRFAELKPVKFIIQQLQNEVWKAELPVRSWTVPKEGEEEAKEEEEGEDTVVERWEIMKLVDPLNWDNFPSS